MYSPSSPAKPSPAKPSPAKPSPAKPSPAKPSSLRPLLFAATFFFGSFWIAIFIYASSFITSKRIGTRYLRWSWICYLDWAMRFVAKLSYKVNDPHKSLKTQAIFAFNHQSNWETFSNCLFIDSTVSHISKDTLQKIPLFGRCFEHCCGLFIDRKGSKKNLQYIMAQGTKYIQKYQHSIFLCPEGTRKPYGTPYQSKPGVYLLYKAFNLPVVPVAHNSGLYWHGFARAHKGCIQVEVAQAIPPGLSKKDFLEQLDKSMQETIHKVDSISQ